MVGKMILMNNKKEQEKLNEPQIALPPAVVPPAQEQEKNCCLPYESVAPSSAAGPAPDTFRASCLQTTKQTFGDDPPWMVQVSYLLVPNLRAPLPATGVAARSVGGFRSGNKKRPNAHILAVYCYVFISTARPLTWLLVISLVYIYSYDFCKYSRMCVHEHMVIDQFLRTFEMDLYSMQCTDTQVWPISTINKLTMRAAQIYDDPWQIRYRIVCIIERCIQQIQPHRKLVPLYVMDSIIKSVGQPYTGMMMLNLVAIFSGAFHEVDNSTRMQMIKLLDSWQVCTYMYISHIYTRTYTHTHTRTCAHAHTHIRTFKHTHDVYNIYMYI